MQPRSSTPLPGVYVFLFRCRILVFWQAAIATGPCGRGFEARVRPAQVFLVLPMEGTPASRCYRRRPHTRRSPCCSMRVEGGGLDGDRSCVGVGGTQAGPERRETGSVTEGDRIYIEQDGASGGFDVPIGEAWMYVCRPPLPTKKNSEMTHLS